MITPVEKVGAIWLKRNDLYTFAGCNGGKTASALKIIQDAKDKGYTGVVTSGSRISPQCEIVSSICEELGMDCIVVLNVGKDTKTTEKLKAHKHTTIYHPYNKGIYQNVLNAVARRLAAEKNYCLVPYGMQCVKNVKLIAEQVQNIPPEVKRIVIPVGSGMSFCGVLQGLVDYNRYDIELIGVQTGGNPFKIIDTFKPKFVALPKHSVVTYMPDAKPAARYDTHLKDVYVGGVKLDEVYEAKCKDFIQDGDLMWIVGIHDV